MELQHLQENGYDNKIKLLFTDCEENGLLGSKLFVKEKFTDLKNKIVINFDCVGRGDNLFITCHPDSKLAKQLQSFLFSKGINSTIYNKSFSDDKSFQKNGLNAIGLIRANRDSKNNKLLHWTHTSDDTLEKINNDYIIELTKLISEFISTIL